MTDLVYRKMVLWTAGLVVSLAGFNTIWLLQAPSRPRARLAKSTVAIRQPASETWGRVETVAVEPSPMADLQVGCSATEALTFPHTTKQVRLKGTYCHPEKQPLQSKVLNLSNRYSATVFQQDTDFSTDFITLTDGENRIQISHHAADGETEWQELSIHRAPANEDAK